MAQNNFKITSIEDVRNAARNINAASEKQNEERRAAIEKVLNGVNSMPFDRGNFDEFAVILALPEEKFAILAPIFMEEFEKSYNNATDKILLAQSINVSGQRLEDIHDTFENMILNIDLEFSEILSQQKRDFLKRILIVTYNAIAETEGIVKRIVDIPIELTSENAKVPKYANLGDGAVDLYSPGDYVIKPGETVIIPCDIKVAIPYGYGFLIHPRSGLSAKTKLRIANSIGLIDSQYKGVIGVIVENIEPPIKDITYEFDKNGKPVLTSVLHGQSYTISKGDRFAQMRLVEVPTANFYVVESVDGIGDDRGGGFGSSGDK